MIPENGIIICFADLVDEKNNSQLQSKNIHIG